MLSTKKKIIFAIIIVFIVAVTVVAVIFLGKGGRSILGGGGGKSIAVGSSDPEIDEIIKSHQPVQPYKETSMDKITAAWESKKITEEQSIIYQMAAIFNSSKLPDEYKGEPEDKKVDHPALFGLINERWSGFSEETKNALRPFLLPPTNPKSFYSSKLKDADKDNIWQKVFGISAAKANIGWISDIDVPGVNATIAYYSEGNDEEDTQTMTAMAGVQEALIDSVPKFQELLGIEPKKIGVFISKEFGGGDEVYLSTGEALGEEAGQCNIDFNPTGWWDAEQPKTFVAHQIFHCFQFWYGFKFGSANMNWFMQSTAVWAEDYVYHTVGSEHIWDSNWFYYTDRPLLDSGNYHDHASYLWFYYLSQSKDPTEIPWFFKKVKQYGGPLSALKASSSFPREFKKFAFWNWNRSPFKKYIDDPNFPNISPQGNSFRAISITSNDEFSDPIMIGGNTASQYIMYTFDNPDVVKIKFHDLGGVVGGHRENRGIQSLIKIDDSWRYEDWSRLQEREFCRETENVKAVVLIVSDANLTGSFIGETHLETKNACEHGWQGTITVKWDKSGVGSRESGSYIIHEKLRYNADEDVFEVREETFSANFDANYSSIGGSCGITRFGEKLVQGGGNFSYDEDYYSQHKDNVRMSGMGNDIKKEGSGGKERAYGGIYNLSFAMMSDPNGPEKGNGFVTEENSRVINNGFTDACEFIIPLRFGKIEDEQTSGGVGGSIYIPNGVEIKIEKGQKSIKGGKTDKVGSTADAGFLGNYASGSDVIVHTDWDFQRVD